MAVGLGFLHGGGDLAGGEVDGGHQIPQLVDGIVDGVGDGPGEVLGNRGGHRQVAVGQVFDFIQQAHDRVLVAFVLLGGFVQLAIGLADHHQADQDDRGQGQQAEDITADGVQGTFAGEVFKTVGQVRGFVQQGLRQAEDIPGRFRGPGTTAARFRGFHPPSPRRIRTVRAISPQAGAGVLVFDLGDFQGRIALQHTVEHLAETGSVATEGIGGLGRGFVAGQHRVHRAEDPLGEQRLTLGHGHLGRRGHRVAGEFPRPFRIRLQLRHGFGQGRGYLVQRQHGLFAGKDGVGVAQQVFPVLLHRVHFGAHGGRRGGQAGGRVAFFQVTPALGEVVARIAQQLERRGPCRKRLPWRSWRSAGTAPAARRHG